MDKRDFLLYSCIAWEVGASMKQIIFDCDNTMGLQGRPMDDALAFLYLLGNAADAHILGIAVNIGNGTAGEVYDCCRRMLKEAKLEHIPLYHGAEREEDPRCESAQFIVSAANKYPGRVSYLGIGSLTNLYGAYLLDPDIFKKLREIVLMGGVTQPLEIHGKPLKELNFSVHAEAAACVLRRGRHMTVITGNNCLPVAYLPKNEFMPNMCLADNPAGLYIAQKCGYRFRDKQVIYGADGSYCWDAVAAAYLLHPELFEDHAVPCRISEEALRGGLLLPAQDAQADNVLNLPLARDRVAFQEELYRSWRALHMDGAEVFPCKGSFLDKLLQPAILVELSQEPCHGFRLLQRLRGDGLLGSDELDPAGMYRTLKRMEQAGYLISRADESGAKPRRIFSVTEFGRYSLLNWETTLQRYGAHIEQLLRGVRAAAGDTRAEG